MRRCGVNAGPIRRFPGRKNAEFHPWSVEHCVRLLLYKSLSYDDTWAQICPENPYVPRWKASRGTVFPLAGISAKIAPVNLHLTDPLIRTTYRDLAAAGAPVSGRSLRRELRKRFGAAGKTARVFAIWREESRTTPPVPSHSLPSDIAELQTRMLAAEASAASNLLRAERAEYREQAHQDHWAMQIDELRERLKAQPQYARDNHRLQEQVLRLSAELQALRDQLQYLNK
jgi:hypothetical protein